MSAADDTTGEQAPPAPDPEPAPRAPLGYYYDDGTGYEVYDPEEDEGPEDEPCGARPRAGN